MSKTLLQLIQATANELGIPEPSQVVGGQDDQSKLMLALANREGKDFSVLANGSGGWQNLHKEYTFTTSVLTGLTGDTTSGSAIITNISSTAGIVADTWAVSANGLTYPARVVSVDSATQITVSQPFQATATAVDLSVAQIAYDLPSDFSYFVNKTFWDGAYKWELLGPITAQEKQILRYGIVASGPRRKFYVRLNKLWLDPLPPANGDIIAFDYFSNAWCSSAAGAAQTEWTADTDVYNLDDDCFIQGLKWRYLRSKGLDYGQEQMDYMNDTQRVMSRDGGSRDLPLSGGTYGAKFLSNDNIPETGFGA